MISSEIQWIGAPIKCPYTHINTGRYIFYNSFMKDNQVFKIGEFIVVSSSRVPEDPKCKEVCRLLCVYESHEDKHKHARFKAFIQRYTFAKQLKDHFNKKRILFDHAKEVVEDQDRIDITINLETVICKCEVTYATPSDPQYLIEAKEKLKFSCRYKISDGQLSEIIPDNNSSLNYSDDSDGDFSDKKTMSKTKSTPSKRKNGRIKDCDTPEKKSRPTPTKKQTNQSTGHRQGEVELKELTVNLEDSLASKSPGVKSVCRNLNLSFDSDPNSSVNYSIIQEDDPDDERLKIKLKRSNRKSVANADADSVRDNKVNTKSPVVIVERLRDEQMSPEKKYGRTLRHNQVTNVMRQETVRRSGRSTQRVSYAEYISPVKSTPTKRERSGSEQSDVVMSQVESQFKELNCDGRRSTRRGSKYYYYESESESGQEDAEENLILTEKRTRKAPGKYLDDEVYMTPKKIRNLREAKASPARTPRSSRQAKAKQFDASPAKTPKTPRQPKAKLLAETPKSTPRAKRKLLKEGAITPSVQCRENIVSGGDTPLMKARSQLHVSYVPKALPCREKEYVDIRSFLEGKLTDGCGGCMYISGVPGTGKTATVTSVINSLLEGVKRGDTEDFKFISVNGMKLTEPRQAYVEIWKQMCGKTVSWEQAQIMLEDKFTKTKKNEPPIILLVDELDILCTKRQDVVYNLLDWPTKSKVQLIVITIANTMDLPERLLMRKVTSRLGLTRLAFQAYTHKQLQEIVTKRLTGTDTFNPDAIQLVARKVASVSGDARRALDICRRAAEIAEVEGPDTYVTMAHVNEALSAMITQPKVQAIKRCSKLEQLILQAVVAEVERTGVEETMFGDVCKMLSSLSTLNGFRQVNTGLVLAAVCRLNACRLLITDQRSDIGQRIILNVSADDVYYALKRD